jgi:hypothetical protein
MNTEKGFLIFYDWMDSISTLSPKDFKTLILAIYEYQRYGTPPPEMSNKAKGFGSFIFPQIERRKYLSAVGKKGANARYRANAQPSGEPCNGNEEGIGEAIAPALAIDKDGDKDKDLDLVKDQNKTTPSKRGRVYSGCYGNSPEDARAEIAQTNVFGEEDTAVLPEKRRFGKWSNVYLTDGEYETLCNTIANAGDYIERFSERLHSKGYRYSDHFKAISEWWERDRNFDSFAPVESSKEKEHQGSFDTDTFFAAAVKRSLGLDVFDEGD